MPQESQSEIFIRLLSDAVQHDRLIRKSRNALFSKNDAKRTQPTVPQDGDDAMNAAGLLDCVQMMAATSIHAQNG